jgi:hypothetical protein
MVVSISFVCYFCRVDHGAPLLGLAMVGFDVGLVVGICFSSLLCR